MRAWFLFSTILNRCFSESQNFGDTLYSCHADLIAFSLVRSFTCPFNAIVACASTNTVVKKKTDGWVVIAIEHASTRLALAYPIMRSLAVKLWEFALTRVNMALTVHGLHSCRAFNAKHCLILISFCFCAHTANSGRTRPPGNSCTIPDSLGIMNIVTCVRMQRRCTNRVIYSFGLPQRRNRFT